MCVDRQFPILMDWLVVQHGMDGGYPLLHSMFSKGKLGMYITNMDHPQR